MRNHSDTTSILLKLFKNLTKNKRRKSICISNYSNTYEVSRDNFIGIILEYNKEKYECITRGHSEIYKMFMEGYTKYCTENNSLFHLF